MSESSIGLQEWGWRKGVCTGRGSVCPRPLGSGPLALEGAAAEEPFAKEGA